ncbi:ankyrin repeat-containing domain protein [Hyaloraphidium curvatum]|nr:ankyrin repeat-containing domain protein [Hyaloraphidium curvatum]
MYWMLGAPPEAGNRGWMAVWASSRDRRVTCFLRPRLTYGASTGLQHGLRKSVSQSRNRGTSPPPLPSASMGNESEFLQACVVGDVATVRKLLRDGQLNVNKEGTALVGACHIGHAEVVRLLLGDRRVDVNSRDGDGRTGFIWSCRAGKADVVRLLLADPRVDVNARDTAGRTGFLYACREDMVDVVRLLLADPRIDVNLKDRDGNTAFAVGTPDTELLVGARLDEAEAARKQQEARLEAERIERQRREAKAAAEETRQRVRGGRPRRELRPQSRGGSSSLSCG